MEQGNAAGKSILCHSRTETPGRIHSHFSTDADNNQGQANYIECHPHIITVIDPVHVQNRIRIELKRCDEPHQFSNISIFGGRRNARKDHIYVTSL